MILSRAVDGGILRGPLPEDPVRTSILVTMFTIAIYQSLIIYIQIFATFKRRNTLYFWSLLIAATGIVSHSLGVILKWFSATCPWYVNTAFASFGWWGMVTGQSLVLYSRLHLVVRDGRVLRSVLVMVVSNFLIFQIPTTILTFGSNQAQPGMWLKVYNVYERIQLIVFTLQELVISIIYIRAAVKMLRPSDPDDTRHTKKFLIGVNVLCIVLDIAFVAEVYSGEWVYKTGTQSLAYAIKLTVEFVVLNKLMSVAREGVSGSMGMGSGGRHRGGHDDDEHFNGSGGTKWASSRFSHPTSWDRRRSEGAHGMSTLRRSLSGEKCADAQAMPVISSSRATAPSAVLVRITLRYPFIRLRQLTIPETIAIFGRDSPELAADTQCPKLRGEPVIVRSGRNLLCTRSLT